ncbi:MAG: phosphatidylglycerophosphatase A [Thiobacillaceae bacterium]
MNAPSLRFLVSHPAHFIALGLGSGLARKAPGTVGTLVALPLFWLLQLASPPLQFACVIVAILVGIWACSVTGRDLGVHDSGHIVWDEIAGFLLVLIFTPPRIGWQLYAFILFRLFDIWKPAPIGWMDAHVKGGFGVMLDDLLAAGYALVVVCITIRLVS